MTLARYQPWTLLDDVRRGFDRALAAPSGALPDAGATSAITRNWAPSVDIKEHQDRFVLYADLPGVDVKDIDITMEKGVLTIKGEREGESASEGSDYRRTERSHGKFSRRFSLPDSTNEDKIAARSQNGVLEVVIPKRAEVQPRKIAVQS